MGAAVSPDWKAARSSGSKKSSGLKMSNLRLLASATGLVALFCLVRISEGQTLECGQDRLGMARQAGDTWSPDGCNSCRCLSGGRAGCTRRLCQSQGGCQEGGGVQVLGRVDPVLAQPGLQQRAGERGAGAGVRGGPGNRGGQAGGGRVDRGLQQLQVLEQRVAGLHKEGLLGRGWWQPACQPKS